MKIISIRIDEEDLKLIEDLKKQIKKEWKEILETETNVTTTNVILTAIKRMHMQLCEKDIFTE